MALTRPAKLSGSETFNYISKEPVNKSFKNTFLKIWNCS